MLFFAFILVFFFFFLCVWCFFFTRFLLMTVKVLQIFFLSGKHVSFFFLLLGLRGVTFATHLFGW